MSENGRVLRLMLVTDRLRAVHPIADVVRLAVAGGVDAVQIREKDLPEDELRVLAREIRDAVPSSMLVLINASIPIARELNIGLHMPENVPLSDIDRSSLANGALIGRSVHSAEAARRSSGFDYLIAGHVFETGSKAGLPVLGLAGLAEIVDAASSPVLAIGGITPERVPAVFEAGAAGVAVMSGICSSQNPRAAAGSYAGALKGATMSGTTKLAGERIDVQINGKPAVLQSGTTVAEFLDQKELHPNTVVVEHNGTILKKGQFAEASINAGDVLEVVHFVGGG